MFSWRRVAVSTNNPSKFISPTPYQTISSLSIQRIVTAALHMLGTQEHHIPATDTQPARTRRPDESLALLVQFICGTSYFQPGRPTSV